MKNWNKYKTWQFFVNITSEDDAWVKFFSIYKKLENSYDCISSWLKETTFLPLKIDFIIWFVENYDASKDWKDLMKDLYLERDNAWILFDDDWLDIGLEDIILWDLSDIDNDYFYWDIKFVCWTDSSWKFIIKRSDDYQKVEELWEFNYKLNSDLEESKEIVFLIKTEKNEFNMTIEKLTVIDLKHKKVIFEKEMFFSWNYSYLNDWEETKNSIFIKDWNSFYLLDNVNSFDENINDFKEKYLIFVDKNHEENKWKILYISPKEFIDSLWDDIVIINFFVKERWSSQKKIEQIAVFDRRNKATKKLEWIISEITWVNLNEKELRGYVIREDKIWNNICGYTMIWIEVSEKWSSSWEDLKEYICFDKDFNLIKWWKNSRIESLKSEIGKSEWFYISWYRKWGDDYLTIWWKSYSFWAYLEWFKNVHIEFFEIEDVLFENCVKKITLNLSDDILNWIIEKNQFLIDNKWKITATRNHKMSSKDWVIRQLKLENEMIKDLINSDFDVISVDWISCYIKNDNNKLHWDIYIKSKIEKYSEMEIAFIIKNDLNEVEFLTSSYMKHKREDKTE